jgi:hypothetical protein
MLTPGDPFTTVPPTAVWVFSYEQALGNTYTHESTRKHLRFAIGQISLKVSPITIEMHCP